MSPVTALVRPHDPLAERRAAKRASLAATGRPAPTPRRTRTAAPSPLALVPERYWTPTSARERAEAQRHEARDAARTRALYARSSRFVVASAMADDPPEMKADQIAAVLQAARALDDPPIADFAYVIGDWLVHEMGKACPARFRAGAVELAQALEEIAALSDLHRNVVALDPTHPAACSPEVLGAVGWMIQSAMEWSREVAGRLAAAATADDTGDAADEGSA